MNAWSTRPQSWRAVRAPDGFAERAGRVPDGFAGRSWQFSQTRGVVSPRAAALLCPRIAPVPCAELAIQ